MRRIDHKIAYLLVAIVFLGTGSAFAAKYIANTKKNVEEVKQQVLEEVVPAIAETVAPIADEAIKEQIAKTPPKHATKQTVTTKPSDGGQVTTISGTGLTPTQTSNYLSNCKSSPTPSGVSYTDGTGRYPALGSTLNQYLNTLRWGGEISSLCGIFIEDAGNTGWSGQYIASYRVNSSGRIVSALGAIILNASDYSTLDEATFNEYMKLILSHEYGHHYTQYHKWIDLNLPIGVRFPDQYYNERPLSKSATITDCSVSWETCDSEIIAEDYSYLYSNSPYNQHQMASQFDYPSGATRTWLDSLVNVTSPDPEPTPPPQNQNSNTSNSNSNANSNTNINANTNSADTTKPVATIIDPVANPYLWDAVTPIVSIKVRTSDNVGVTAISLYSSYPQCQAEGAESGADITCDYSSAGPGTYSVRAEAYDAAGNMGEIILTIKKS